MVQILQRAQTTGDRLSQSVYGAASQGIPDVAKHLMQQRATSKEDETLKKLLGQDVSGLSPDLKKLFLQESMKRQTVAQQLQAKDKVAQEKKQQEQQGLNNALDWLDENIEYAGSQAVPGTKNWNPLSLIPGGEIFPNSRRGVEEKREEFDTTGFWAADKLFTHFNKGAVTKDKLKVIQKDLAPRTGISERKNKARIASMRRMANLDPGISKQEFDRALEDELSNVKKTVMRAPNGEEIPMDPKHVNEAIKRGWKLI